ncbi:MAG: chromate efflux transporter [Chloroflexota bacterium]|nr:chromate efflux transporter [Chloroflexota bacterium]
MAAPITETSLSRPDAPTTIGLWPLTAYFLRLGAIGFGGPVALVGHMHRDLVEQRKWVSEDDYKLALALAQLMPGPLAAQFAIALGYILRGIIGATVVGLAFVIPSFLMVLGISMLYVAYGGLWWMQALFYGVGAAVVAIIVIAAYKLARGTIKRDPLLWAIFGVLMIVTVITQAELALLFVLAGLAVALVRAFPKRLKMRLPLLSLAPLPIVPLIVAATDRSTGKLLSLFFFFIKAGAFVFGSGLAVVPFLYEGVVQQHGWLNEQQFRDAVAVAMITPGPVVITVAFIGYLIAGFAGASVAAAGIFLPVYFLTIIPLPWFRRHRDNAFLKAFVAGATAAAVGAIAGAVIVIGRRALVDLPTVLIALVTLGLLLRFKPPEPALVVASGAVGVLVWVLI